MAEGNGRERELGMIQATLVSIQQKIAEGDEGRRRLHEKQDATMDAVRTLAGKVDAVQTTVGEMKPLVDDYRSTKAKGVGILIGVAAAGGTVGAGMKALLAKVGLGS